MSETRLIETRLIETLAYSLYLSGLVGNPAPKVAQMVARMQSPRVGDLVLEMSTIYMEDRNGTRLGRLVREAWEPFCTATEWEAQGGGSEPIPKEHAWYIALPSGLEYRWHNASFMAVPTNILGRDESFLSDPDALLETRPPHPSGQPAVRAPSDRDTHRTTEPL